MNPKKSVSRRRFLKTASGTALAVGAGPAVIIPGHAQSATGKMTHEEALTQADQEVRKIYDKWRALGKI